MLVQAPAFVSVKKLFYVSFVQAIIRDYATSSFYLPTITLA